MPHDPTASDDALAEALADQVIGLVQQYHPSGDAKSRRRLARLYLRQLTGSEKPPGEISESRVGEYLGISRQRVHEIKTSGLSKLWLALRERHPDLF